MYFLYPLMNDKLDSDQIFDFILEFPGWDRGVHDMWEVFW